METTTKYKRDENSGAVVNIDNDSLLSYRLRKKNEMKMNNRIENIEMKLKNLDDKINNILNILVSMENK